MPSRSHRKGDSGERELCKILTGIFGENFSRVPSSGAMIGGINVARMANLSETQILLYRGDIIPPDSLPRMIIEVKYYADFPFHQLVQNNGLKLLDGWIDQAKSSASDQDTWFLAFKINRKGWFASFDVSLLDSFSVDNYARYKTTVILELVPFFEQNRDALLRLCGKKRNVKHETAYRTRSTNQPITL